MAEYSVSVAGVIVDAAGRVLVIRRADNGRWEAPGGVLEVGETFAQGVRREVAAETGVSVSVGELSGVYQNMERGVVALVFRCSPLRGTAHRTQEAAEVRWMTRDEVRVHLDPAFGVRVLDAFRPGTQYRAHDGVHLHSDVGIVRVRTDDDVSAAASVLTEVYATDGYPVEGVQDSRSWLRAAGLLRAWVAELDGRIVGHVAVTEPQDTDAAPRLHRSAETLAVLGRLFVLPEARGRTLGAELVTTAVDYAQRSSTRLVLDVLTKDTAAIRLYERLGWTRIGSAMHEYGSGNAAEALCYRAPDGVPG